MTTTPTLTLSNLMDLEGIISLEVMLVSPHSLGISGEPFLDADGNEILSDQEFYCHPSEDIDIDDETHSRLKDLALDYLLSQNLPQDYEFINGCISNDRESGLTIRYSVIPTKG